MDPLTQGVLGATLPQASVSGRYAASAGLLGFLSGLAADLDVLIRSSTDPLLFLEYHRQFTQIEKSFRNDCVPPNLEMNVLHHIYK